MERGFESLDFEKVWRGRGRLAGFVTLLPGHFISKRATDIKKLNRKVIQWNN